MSGGHSGSLFQLSTTDDSREASHTRGLAAGVPPLPSHPGVRWELVTPMEYDLYNLADTHRRPCACLPSAWRRLCCWDNSFNLPGFNRATYDGTLVELGVERHEFDELKRRVCDATDGYRATPFWLWLLFFPAVGTAAALQGTVLRGTLAGAIFPILAVAVVYGIALAHHDRVCKHNANVDEQVDAVLGDLNARKGRAVCALRREHVGQGEAPPNDSIDNLRCRRQIRQRAGIQRRVPNCKADDSTGCLRYRSEHAADDAAAPAVHLTRAAPRHGRRLTQNR